MRSEIGFIGFIGSESLYKTRGIEPFGVLSKSSFEQAMNVNSVIFGGSGSLGNPVVSVSKKTNVFICN